MDFIPIQGEKTTGNYKKTALTSIRFGPQRYFILKRGFNIIGNDAFKQSNQVFQAAVVQLKRQGFAKIRPSLTSKESGLGEHLFII